MTSHTQGGFEDFRWRSKNFDFDINQRAFWYILLFIKYSDHLNTRQVRLFKWPKPVRLSKWSSFQLLVWKPSKNVCFMVYSVWYSSLITWSNHLKSGQKKCSKSQMFGFWVLGIQMVTLQKSSQKCRFCLSGTVFPKFVAGPGALTYTIHLILTQKYVWQKYIGKFLFLWGTSKTSRSTWHPPPPPPLLSTD